MSWSRREFLGAFLHAVGGTFAVPMAAALPMPLAATSGCGEAPSPALQTPAPPRMHTPDALRQELHGAVAWLSQRFATASGTVTIDDARFAMIDGDIRVHRERHQATLRLAVTTDAGAFEMISSGFRPGDMVRVAAQLADQAHAGSRDRGQAAADVRGAGRRVQNREDQKSRGKREERRWRLTMEAATIAIPTDVAALSGARVGGDNARGNRLDDGAGVSTSGGRTNLSPDDAWMRGLEDLYARARRVGDGRIIHRACYFAAQARWMAYVDDARDWVQELARGRSGIALAAIEARPERGAGSSLPSLHIEFAQQSGSGRSCPCFPSDDAIAAASERVLTLFTPRRPPAGHHDVVFGPDAAAQFLGACVGPWLLARADRGVAIGESGAGDPGALEAAAVVSITDEPGLAGSYGRYEFDEFGRRAQKRSLITAGKAVHLDTEHLCAPLANMRLIPGRHPVAALIGEVTSGFLLDGAQSAELTTYGGQCVLHIARAREIARGRLTGIVYADMKIMGHVGQILRAVRAVAAGGNTYVWDDMAGTPCSATSPALLTRAMIGL